MQGFLNVFKPENVTSNFVVQKLKKAMHLNKIGHFGTLDPMASGVLPVAIGKATRLFDYSLNKTKSYIAVFDFGYSTDTLDTTGKIENTSGTIPTMEQINAILPKFIGSVSQMPPKFSAKNINGNRAYKLARLGIDFELKPKQIEIYSLKCLEKVTDNSFKFEIICSSGTYIRSIGRDLAESLNTFATMSSLLRTSCGNFDIAGSVPLDKLCVGKLEDYLISITDVFNFPKKYISDSELTDVLNGKNVPFETLKGPTFILCNDKLVGIAKTNLSFLKIDVNLYE